MTDHSCPIACPESLGDLLLREQFHRFSNSFQIVSALARQCYRLRDQAGAGALMDGLERRLEGLTIVHRLLAAPFAIETFAEQTLELARAFVATFDREDEVIVEFDPFWLPPDQRLRFALIIAELLTNSLKHSLRDKPPGWISVSIAADAETITLTVTDSGRSSAAATSPAPSRMIAALATSIGAVADVVDDGGYVGRVSKPLCRSDAPASLTLAMPALRRTGRAAQ